MSVVKAVINGFSIAKCGVNTPAITVMEGESRATFLRLHLWGTFGVGIKFLMPAHELPYLIRPTEFKIALRF